jgi:putative transposase
MARRIRYSIPGIPHHVIQRGNNRGRIFQVEEDFYLFRECIRSAVLENGCALHAYVLMPNHLHLLISPDSPNGIARTIQAISRRYVRQYNKRHSRTGTLWEGRYRSTVVESERYLFTCYRYIEHNPVRAGLVSTPEEYRWSSFAANAFGTDDDLVRPHETYLALAPTVGSRQENYRAMYRSQLPEEDLQAIRFATVRGWALGSDAFRESVRTSVLGP